MIVLPDADGRNIRLGSLWATRPAVLVFLRHYGCIFCRQLVCDLRQSEQSFADKGVSIAAIGLGDQHYAREFRNELKITFPLLVDEKRQAYEAAELRTGNLFGVFKRETIDAKQRALAAGHKQGKLGKNPFQLGGSFIFGPGDRDRFAHICESFTDNATPAALLASIP